MEEKKKNDIKLIAAIVAAALGVYVGMSFWQGTQTQNAQAVVFIDGVEYGTFPLDVEMEEKIELSDGAYNVLVIKDGKADVTEASCPDGICVSHRPVSKQNQSITCLPNKLVVEIKNGEVSDLDAVTN